MATRQAPSAAPAEDTRSAEMDLHDRQVLNVIQTAFPMDEQPYMAIARELGLEEDDVIERIRRMRRENVVRQISGIFDTRRLGYKTSLIAFRYPDELLHKGALAINKHPGVSHNYARVGHEYNLWFTLAVPPYGSLEETAARMAEETHVESWRLLPTLRFFKIGVNFDMVNEEGNAADYRPDNARWNQVEPLTEYEIEVVREVQEDLSLDVRPFDKMSARLGLTPAGLFDIMRDFEARGVMRRYSAVLHHRKAGFRSNAMSVWRVPEERKLEVGQALANSRWVSHCYERPVFEDWPYSHFAMIHATSRARCETVAKELSELTGVDDYILLYSTREYKKTRVRYFV
ncbi:MAG: Lrp/AsnC family transcriptional regulator [Chloroflexota bacterium]|nr:Lrp/AsnC family transcriptional regulator [Chloroflexota bacterium]